jgi:PTS system cellobiose-specific IIB component
MRSLAASAGLDLTVKAASDSELDAWLPSITVLLVGPHLAPTFESLRKRADECGVRTELLPPTAFGAGGAEAALDLVTGVVPSGRPDIQPSTKGSTHG